MPTSKHFLDVCIRCKAYCCSIVRPPVTKKEKQDIINAGFKDHFIDVGNGIYEIETGKNNNCPYLEEDFTCKIHKVKPQLCRVWPVVPKSEITKKSYLVIKCPLYKYLSEENLKHAKKEANRIPIPIIKHLWKVSSEMKNKFKIFEYKEI